MRLERWRGIAAVALALSVAAPAAALAQQQIGAANVDQINADIVAQEIQTLGYGAKINQDAGGDPRVDTAVDGHPWQIYFYDCDKTGALEQRRCQSFQFFADNNMPAPVPAGTIVRWNSETTYAKAFLQQQDEAGCEANGACAARIEVDVLTAGTGADPAQTFRSYFAIFKQRADEFRRVIGAH
jgi:hypothetical protein